MQLLTERQLILSVIERWKDQYPAGKCTVWQQEVLTALEQLDLTAATAEDIEAIIGNFSWTSIRCDECGSQVKAAVQLGEDLDHDSATAVVCFPCLKKALELEPNTWLRG